MDEVTQYVVQETLKLRARSRNEASCKACFDIGWVLDKLDSPGNTSPAVFARVCPQCEEV